MHGENLKMNSNYIKNITLSSIQVNSSITHAWQTTYIYIYIYIYMHLISVENKICQISKHSAKQNNVKCTPI